MKKTALLVAAFGVCIFSARAGLAGDRFSEIKKTLSEAGCTHVEFLSIIESNIFDQVDTAEGWADIARDGRYRIAVGTDEYLAADGKLYSYSKRHQQVTVEQLPPDMDRSTEISFVIRLDDFFKTVMLRPDSSYTLYRTSDDVVGLPDSLTVTIRADRSEIAEIVYLDVNGELNRIEFQSIEPSPSCDPRRFEPNYPDSVEIITLP